VVGYRQRQRLDKRGIEMVQKLELMKNNTESLLLFLISQQPMYGYHIIKELEKRSGGYFKFKEGTLYPALHRLEKRNLIEGKWQALTGGRRRRYYFITDKGNKLLAVKQSEWHNFLKAMELIIRPTLT
jgi:PadR family transcriptional regulator PadR